MQNNKECLFKTCTAAENTSSIIASLPSFLISCCVCSNLYSWNIN